MAPPAPSRALSLTAASNNTAARAAQRPGRMWRTGRAWCALVMALWGCDDHALPGEALPGAPHLAPPDLDAAWAWLTQALAAEVCEPLWDCPEALTLLPPTAGRFASARACGEAVLAALDDPAGLVGDARPPVTYEALSRALASGEVTWDAAGAAACAALDLTDRCALAQRASAWAAGQWPADSPCARALVGRGDVGARCEGGWACAPGLRCLPDPDLSDDPYGLDLACPRRRCAPPSRSTCAAPGAPPQACGPWSRCDAGRCVDEGRAGDQCEDDWGCAQGLGLVCGDAGRCVRVSDLPRRAEGAPCEPSRPWRCAPHLRCVAGRCAPVSVSAEGQPCDLTGPQPTTCAGDSACWGSLYTGEAALCARAADLGGACRYDVQCPWGTVCASSRCTWPATEAVAEARACDGDTLPPAQIRP
jgi:hypothetical protein